MMIFWHLNWYNNDINLYINSETSLEKFFTFPTFHFLFDDD